MIKFEKVSYEQFRKDCLKLLPDMEEERIKYAYDNIILPKRSSIGSAGYDIYTTFDFVVDKDPVTIPLGIRAIMPEDVVLFIVPRSGVGFKTGSRLSNTIGVIDASYYQSPNEGHIMLKLTPGFKPLVVQQKDRVVQGIFTPYLLTDDDSTTEIRSGGLGSSGK